MPNPEFPKHPADKKTEEVKAQKAAERERAESFDYSWSHAESFGMPERIRMPSNPEDGEVIAEVIGFYNGEMTLRIGDKEVRATYERLVDNEDGLNTIRITWQPEDLLDD